MRGRATGLGDDAEDEVFIQRRRLRRREVVRDQDGRLGQVRNPRLRQPTQASCRAVTDVVEVGDTLRHVAADLAQFVGVKLHCVVDRLRRAGALLQLFVDAADEALVGCQPRGRLQHGLRRVRVGVLGACGKRRRDVVKHIANSLTVGLRIGGGGLVLVKAHGGRDHGDRAGRGAGRYADAVQDGAVRHLTSHQVSFVRFCCFGKTGGQRPQMAVEPIFPARLQSQPLKHLCLNLTSPFQ